MVLPLLYATILSVPSSHFFTHEKSEPQRAWETHLGFWLSQGCKQTLRMALHSSPKEPSDELCLWIDVFVCDTVVAFAFFFFLFWKEKKLRSPCVSSMPKSLLLWSLKIFPQKSQARVESSSIISIFRTWKFMWLLICVEFEILCVRLCVCVRYIKFVCTEIFMQYHVHIWVCVCANLEVNIFKCVCILDRRELFNTRHKI